MIPSNLDIFRECCSPCYNPGPNCESDGCVLKTGSLNCVILKADDCLRVDKSCDFIIFVDYQSRLTVVYAEFKTTERPLSELKCKFIITDLFASMILRGVYGLEPHECNFVLLQVSRAPSAHFSSSTMESIGVVKMPGGQFKIALEWTGIELVDVLKKYQPKSRNQESLRSFYERAF